MHFYNHVQEQTKNIYIYTHTKGLIYVNVSTHQGMVTVQQWGETDLDGHEYWKN